MKPTSFLGCHPFGKHWLVATLDPEPVNLPPLHSKFRMLSIGCCGSRSSTAASYRSTLRHDVANPLILVATNQFATVGNLFQDTRSAYTCPLTFVPHMRSSCSSKDQAWYQKNISFQGIWYLRIFFWYQIPFLWPLERYRLCTTQSRVSAAVEFSGINHHHQLLATIIHWKSAIHVQASSNVISRRHVRLWANILDHWFNHYQRYINHH